MKVKDIPPPMFGDPIGPWHKFTAFWPRKSYDGRLIWLENAWRRRVQTKVNLDGPIHQWWQYAVDDAAHR